MSFRPDPSPSMLSFISPVHNQALQTGRSPVPAQNLEPPERNMLKKERKTLHCQLKRVLKGRRCQEHLNKNSRPGDARACVFNPQTGDVFIGK